MSSTVENSSAVVQLEVPADGSTNLNQAPASPKAPQGRLQAVLSRLVHTSHETDIFASPQTNLIQHLHERLPGVRFRVVPYGSLVTGLALPGTSDADFTIIFEDDKGGSSRHIILKRLNMITPIIERAADAGSFVFIHSARVPVIKFSLAGVDCDFTANSMEAEEATTFIKSTIDESPAYKQAVLLTKHYFTPLGLMASNLGGLSSFVLSLIVRSTYKREPHYAAATHLTEKMFVKILFHFTTFDFAKMVLRVDGEPIPRSESQVGAVFIQPFLGKGPSNSKRNVASSLTAAYWDDVQSAARKLFLGISDSTTKAATWAELLVFSPDMTKGRDNLAALTTESFSECLRRQNPVQDVPMPPPKQEKRRAEDIDDLITTNPLKRARYPSTPQTAHGSRSAAASLSKVSHLAPTATVARSRAKKTPSTKTTALRAMHPPRRIVLSPGISAVIYSSPPPATLRKAPVDAKALGTAPLETGVVSVSGDRRAMKETSSRANVAAPLPPSLERKVAAATSSRVIVGLPRRLITEKDGRQDGLVDVREKQVLRKHPSGNPLRSGNLNSVIGRVGAVEAKEVKQTATSSLGSSVASAASAYGLHCTIQ